ncbi:glycosyltransferase family 4 protein [Patescibacteria group bacterium]|nr:glycosyltransferase family 4 protein [Patescibacteria group bacterium]
MLIGIDASRANKDKKTGVEWYSYHLIEEFKKIDRENRYFLYTNVPLRGKLSVCPPNFEEKILKWPIPRSWTIGRLSLEMKFGKEIPDVLFVPAHTLPLLNPKKSVVTIHDIGFEHFPEAYHWADKLYHKLIIQLIKRSASKIISVSKYTKDDIVKTYKIPAKKIEVVLNGFDDENYKVSAQGKNILKEKCKIDFPYILFIGRLELKKNIPRLVEAFAKFKLKNPDDRHKLVLIGTRGLTFPLVEEQMKKFKIENEIIFPGWVSDDDLPIFLNNADLFVFPSIFEGFGIPVLEAMACGCPVICSNSTSLPEAAGEAALLFDPADVDEIVSRMEQVLLNPVVAESLEIKGFERAKNFSWKKCAEQTLKILTEAEV